MKSFRAITVFFLFLVAAIPRNVSADATSTAFSVAGDIASDAKATFSFSANPGEKYSIFLSCPLGVVTSPGEPNACKDPVSLTDLSGQPVQYSLALKNETTIDQTVVATLVISNTEAIELTRVTVLFRVHASPALRASISSFAVDQATVQGAAGVELLTARFAGKNIDTYHIRFKCPEPGTIAGIRERLAVILSGKNPIQTASEADRCGETQTISAASEVASSKIQNPFKTPQSVSVLLQAYSWDGEKEVLGDEQTRAIILNQK